MIRHLLIELVQFLAYSGFGFLTGWVGCSYKKRLDRIAEEVTVIAEGDSDENDNKGTRGGPGGVGGIGGVGGTGGGQGGTGGPGGEGGSGGHSRGEHGVPRWLGVVLIALSLITVGEGYYFNRQDKQQVECQARYNEDFARALMLRNTWANEDRDANAKMWRDVLAGASPAIRRQSVVDYLATIDRNNEKRAKTPLPNLDQRNCEN